MSTFDPIKKELTIECDICGTKISMGCLANLFQIQQHHVACAQQNRVLDSAVGIASMSHTQVEDLVSKIHIK